MNSVLGAFLLTFAGLFPIVNPLEAAPFFLGLTAGMPTAERRALARKAATNGFALLLGSMLLGPWLLQFFGIELPVLRIAGGLVVNSLLSLWLFERFGFSLAQAGAFFFWTGLLSAASQFAAPLVARRIGLLNTMVFTHIPANVCLIAAALFFNGSGLIPLLIVGVLVIAYGAFAPTALKSNAPRRLPSDSDPYV